MSPAVQAAITHAEEFLAALPAPPNGIHTTLGVYPDGTWKVNGVPAAMLRDHVRYNLTYRPGRALVVDGTVVYPGGGVTAAQIAHAFRKTPRCTSDTQPYQ